MHTTDIPVGIGIDLGSSAVRVGLFNINDDSIIQIHNVSVAYYYDDDPSCLWNYTQSSDEIMSAIQICFDKLCISDYEVRSCGISATCSMAIFSKMGHDLKPLNFSSHNKHKPGNVVFWMDSSALKSCQELNTDCSATIRDFMGGNFIPEMGVTKLKRLIDHIRNSDCIFDQTIEVFDLHRYIAFHVAKQYGWDYDKIVNTPNDNNIGHDGELSGWSLSFYKYVLGMPENIVIGPVECRQLNKVPDSGVKHNQVKIDSCIDCYSSWFYLCSPDLPHSLFMVGGTSSCYLYCSSTLGSTIPGVWGPFKNILRDMGKYAVFESGQSCTGRLIEHLFETHPASSKTPANEWPNLINSIEGEIHLIEKETQESIHFKTKNMFLYGDLQGNRTPYGDPNMTGMFIGETPDISFRNLVCKYVCVLEFLAFQIRLMIQLFGEHNGNTIIKELRACGSQAKNHRLLSITSIVNKNISIVLPDEDVAYSGVSGAYLLGKSSSLDIPLLDIITKRERKLIQFAATIPNNERLAKLLEVKFHIHIEMAKQQMKYRKLISEAIEF